MALLRKAGVMPPAPFSRRLTALARRTAAVAERDVVVLGMIPWRYRIQRPQHLAVELGRRGWRVFYVNPDFVVGADTPPFWIEESPADNVYSLRLRHLERVDIHAAPPGPSHVGTLAQALETLAEEVTLRAPALLLQAPFWLPVARQMQRSILAYDCMDLYRAFPNAKAGVVALEDQLLSRADVVIFSSAPLRERTEVGGRSVVIRNAGEFARFAEARPLKLSERPTVGYVGAIDRWFDMGLLERCAEQHPEWDFVLVGSSAGLPSDAAPRHPNLRLHGEIDYEDVPRLVRGFDVCVVPFADTTLTRCVDPVKVYEYLAAGRPVVATALPELQRLETGLVHLASTPEEFLAGVERAMAGSTDEELIRRRRAWSARQTWGARAEALARALA
jgi:hypothetical protein